VDYAGMIPFAGTVGVSIVEAAADRVVGTLEWAPERTTTGGGLHGGALMTLADCVGAVCAYLNLPDGASTSTISSATNFLRGVRAGTVTAVARPIHAGRSFTTVVTELRDDDDKLVAQVTQTQAVLYPR